MFATACKAVCLTLAIRYIVQILYGKRKHLPPGPTSYPIIGHLLSAPQSFEHLAYEKLSKELKSESCTTRRLTDEG